MSNLIAGRIVGACETAIKIMTANESRQPKISFMKLSKKVLSTKKLKMKRKLSTFVDLSNYAYT